MAPQEPQPALSRAAAAASIDHTLLDPRAGPADIARLCEEAIRHGFAAVCVRSQFLPLATQRLQGSSVRVATVIDFPHGASETGIAVAELQRAQDLGAHELDAVFPIGLFLAGEEGAVMERLERLVAARRPGRLLKMILETGSLELEAKRRAAELSVQAGVDYLKTSTGFAGSGATIPDVQLLVQVARGRARVKASGGIRDRKTLEAMIALGADRIGTSSGVAIVSEYLA